MAVVINIFEFMAFNSSGSSELLPSTLHAVQCESSIQITLGLHHKAPRVLFVATVRLLIFLLCDSLSLHFSSNFEALGEFIFPHYFAHSLFGRGSVIEPTSSTLLACKTTPQDPDAWSF